MNEFKLLISLLSDMENIVAAVINAIDNSTLEYLDDDLEGLDSLGIKHRFMKAIMEKQKTIAFKLIGRFREMDEGEDYYLEALAHFTNEEYKEAIRYANRLKPNDLDYGSAISLILESYAILGDANSLIDTLKNNKNMKYSKYHILYLKQQLISALNFTYTEDLKQILNDLEDEFNALDMTLDEDYYFEELSNQYFSKVAVEGITLIESVIYYISINDDNIIKDETVDRLVQLRFILDLMEDEMGYLLDVEYVLNKGLDRVKEEASEYFY